MLLNNDIFHGIGVTSYMSERLTQEEFLVQAREKHGDWYDYSEARYVNHITKLTIICPIHGAFEQTAKNHIGGHGHGCPECGRGFYTKEVFIDKAETVHGDVYIYSNDDYVSASTHVDIICVRHGVFSMRPNAHLRGGRCPRCVKQEKFVVNARKAHGNWYDYSEADYINASTPVKIICPIDGPFMMKPSNHLHGSTLSNGPSSCPRCGYRGMTKTTATFKKEANVVHGGRYDYSEVDYVKGTVPVKIICKIHGVFEQRPSSHLMGSNCPYCYDVNNRFDLHAPTLLYYLRVTDIDYQVYYKIGITSKTVDKRYDADELDHIEILWEKRYSTGFKAFEIEQSILCRFNAYRLPANYVSVLKSGWTELFKKDVLSPLLERI